MWLEAASTEDFTLTSTFSGDAWKSMPDRDAKETLFGRGEIEFFDQHFDLSIILHSSGDEKISFDAHFGMLQRPCVWEYVWISKYR